MKIEKRIPNDHDERMKIYIHINNGNSFFANDSISIAKSYWNSF